MQIKETRYSGITFRSRLEARWAVFFDKLGLKWEYEPEGFQLDQGVGYLPDFFVHGVSGTVGGKKKQKDGLFIEVKGNLTPYDCVKLNGFEYPIFVVGDVPNATRVWDDVSHDYREAPDFMFSENTIDGKKRPLWFAECDDGIRLIGYEDKEKCDFRNWCESACLAANDAKFERWNNKGGIGSGFDHEIKTDNHTRKPFAQRADESYKEYLKRMNRKWEEEQEVRREQERIRIEEYKRLEKEFVDSIPKIPLNQIVEMYLEMPGIKEYGLEKIARTIGKEDIPEKAVFTGHIENERFMLQYACYIMEGDFVYNPQGDIVSFADKKRTSFFDNKHADMTIRRLCNAIDMLNKEMCLMKEGNQTKLSSWQEEKAEKRKKILEEIDQKRRDEEEYNVLFREKNPYTFGKFMECFKKTVNGMRDELKYADTLSGISLNEVKEDDRFGVEGVILSVHKHREKESWIQTTNRSYHFVTSNGKSHFLSDSRSWFQFAKREDTTDSNEKDYIIAMRLSDELRKVVDKTARNYPTN